MSLFPSLVYTVSCIHPDTGKFHGESCDGLEEAKRRAEELRTAGYRSVTVSRFDLEAARWPRN
jgi:hypothetical protein